MSDQGYNVQYMAGVTQIQTKTIINHLLAKLILNTVVISPDKYFFLVFMVYLCILTKWDTRPQVSVQRLHTY